MIADQKLKEIRTRLKNHTEEIVLNMLQELLNKDEYNDICTSEECLLDMATYALNRLPAKYVATEKGEVYTKTEELEQQHSVDILSVVTRAIKVVNENRRD